MHASVKYPGIRQCQFLLPPPQSTIIQGVFYLSIGVTVLSSDVLSGWTLRVKSELKSA